ncbi:MAG: hypothetical protein ABFE08_21310 [Armatimonadia bacterium]
MMKPQPSPGETGTEGQVALDRLLAWRGVRHHSLGPTGQQLCCSRLENAFGMQGQFHYGTDDLQDALVDPVRLSILVNGQPMEGKRASCMWYPSHVRRQTRESDLGLIECKFITFDNVICDVLELTNHGEEALKLRLEARTADGGSVARWGHDMLVGQRALQNERLWLVLAMKSTRTAPSEALICDLALQPGEQASLMVGMGLHPQRSEAAHRLGAWAASDDPLQKHVREFHEWFEANCPAFDCPDENIVRLWWYHWFVLRHNLRVVEGAPRLPLSAVSQARWLRDGKSLHDMLRPAFSLEADSVRTPRLVQQALLVWPEAEVTSAAAEAAVRAVAQLRQQRDPDHDLLLTEGEGVVSVAETAEFCASLAATADLCTAAGRDVDAKWHRGLAERCRQAILECLWDEWDHSFYGLNEQTGEHMRQPQAANLTPYALDLVPADPAYDHPLRRQPEDLLQLAGAHQPENCGRLAEALAVSARRRGEKVTPRRWAMDCLWLQARLACEEADWHRPLVYQYYTDDGSPWGAMDWLHGAFNDLLIRHLVGVTPRGDNILEIDPLAVGWDYFRLWNLPYRGHEIGIIWESRPEHEHPPQTPPGLSVWVDGRMVAQSPSLERLTVPLD